MPQQALFDRLIIPSNGVRTLIEEIRQKIDSDRFEFSKHAVDQTIIRSIGIDEVREAIRNGEIIEDYPDDKYGPTCLIYGKTNEGRPVHVQCSYPSRSVLKIVTVYEPEAERWIDYRIRR